jgi:hypothetical protein
VIPVVEPDRPIDYCLLTIEGLARTPPKCQMAYVQIGNSHPSIVDIPIETLAFCHRLPKIAANAT